MAGETDRGDRPRSTPAEIQARIAAREARNTGDKAELTGSGSSGGLSGGQVDLVGDLGVEVTEPDMSSGRKTVLKPMRWDDRDLVPSDEEGRGESDQPPAGEQGLAPTAVQDSETGPSAELGEVPQRVVPAAAAEAGEILKQGNPGIVERVKDRFKVGVEKLLGIGSGSTESVVSSPAAGIVPPVEVSSTPVTGTAEAETPVASPPPAGGPSLEVPAGTGISGKTAAGPEGQVVGAPLEQPAAPAPEPGATTAPRVSRPLEWISEMTPEELASFVGISLEEVEVLLEAKRLKEEAAQAGQPSDASPEPGAEQLSSPEKPPLDLSQPVKVGGTPEDLQATGERIVAELKASGSADVPVSFIGTIEDLETLRQLLAEAGITPKSPSRPVIRDGIVFVTATFSPPAASESPASAAAEPATPAESLEASSVPVESTPDASSSAPASGGEAVMPSTETAPAVAAREAEAQREALDRENEKKSVLGSFDELTDLIQQGDFSRKSAVAMIEQGQKLVDLGEISADQEHDLKLLIEGALTFRGGSLAERGFLGDALEESIGAALGQDEQIRNASIGKLVQAARLLGFDKVIPGMDEELQGITTALNE